MKTRGVALTTALLLCAVMTTHAAEAVRPLIVEGLSTRDGLPQGTVLATLQDRQGFVWIGTEDGLVRFDGHEVHRYSYNYSAPGGLPGNFVHALAEDSRGDLWIAVKGSGLARWNRRSDTFTTYRHDPEQSDSIASDAVRTVMVDRLGTIWIGLLDGGVDTLVPVEGRFRHLRHHSTLSDSLADDQVQSIYQDHTGAVWVGTHGGLDQAKPDRQGFQHFSLLPHSGGVESPISQIVEDAVDHTLWVGTFDAGLVHLTPTGVVLDRLRHVAGNAESLSNDDIRAILDDHAGHLWVGTPDGLDLLDRSTGHFSHYGHNAADPDGLGDSFIMSLNQDANGLVWIGTRAAGVFRWSPHSWELGASRPKWLEGKLVTAFADAEQGQIWIASLGGGLVKFDPVTGHSIELNSLVDKKDALTENRIMALREDRAGTLWIGTMASGLKRLIKGQILSTPVRRDDVHSTSAAGIMSIFEARNGLIWVGTHGGGANIIDPSSGSVRQLPFAADQPGSISSDNVTSFLEDARGNFWIGTDSGGLDLARPDGSVIKVFRHDPKDPASLSANTVYALAMDSNGGVWVATDGGGLEFVEGSSTSPESVRFRNISTSNGLTSDTIYGVIPDSAGRLWLSGNSGLMRYDPPSGSVKTFHREHGLQGEEFDNGATFRTRDGRLCFGGPGGFNVFSPGELSEARTPPRLVLTHLEVLGSPLRSVIPYWLIEHIDLDYKANLVSLDFSALDFTALNRNQLAYRVSGLTDEWINLGSLRRVTLTNLEPGDHLLQVRAVNADSVWSATPLQLILHKQAPPWRSNLAYALYFLALAAGIGAVVRSQRRKLNSVRAVQQRLESEVALRTSELREMNRQLVDASESKSRFLARMGHELRTPMNGVVGMTELLARSELSVSQARQTRTIRNSAQALLRILNDLLDLSKAQAGKIQLERLPVDLLRTVEEAVALFSGTVEAKGVSLIVIPPGHARPRLMGDPLRISQILMNLIGNAVKFTDRGEITIRLGIAIESNTQASVRMSVTDTGIGMSEASLAHIFEPFSQADETTTRRFGGTGLGLAICREFVHAMGGTIDIQSVPQMGSTFVVALPMDVAQEPEESAPGAPTNVSVRCVLRHRSLFESLEGYLSGLRCAGAVQHSHDIAAVPLTGEEILIWDLDSMPASVDTPALAAAAADRRLITVGSSAAIKDTRIASCVPAEQILNKPLTEDALREAFTTLASDTAEPARPKSVATGETVHRMHVLVVEDELINATVAQGYLHELGCTSVWMRNGSDAVAQIAVERFDLILMDLNMPGLDGYGTTRLIRQRADQPRVPIVALTANDAVASREGCVSAGMDDILSKPYSIEQCAQILRRWSATRNGSASQPVPAVAAEHLAAIDATIVRGLQQLGNGSADLYPRLVALFGSTSRATLLQIRGALEAGNFDDVTSYSHRLKGAAANVGALACSKHLAQLETTSRRQDAAGAQSLYDELERALPQILNELELASVRAAA